MRTPSLHACGSALLLIAVLASSSMAETIRCKATRDVWLSASWKDKELDCSMGAAKTIKLKSWQEFGIVDFDVSALKGKAIREAWLYLKPAGGHKLGLNGGTDLRWLSVSTVSHDWVEGKGTDYRKDTEGHGATFNESSFGKEDWGWPRARVWNVILGNGNTLRFDGQLKPTGNGWLRIRLDPRLVQALAADATHGLLVMDGSVSWHANCMIASRESGNGPYIEVITTPSAVSVPVAPTSIQVKPCPQRATPKHGALEVQIEVPKDAFAYHVRINGNAVERWQLPFAAKAGRKQSIYLVDLKPESDAKVEFAVANAAGNRSPYKVVQTRVSPPLRVPKLPVMDFTPKGGEPPTLGKGTKVWAFPEVTKVDPVSAKVVCEDVASEYRKRNAVWDASSRTIRIAAARGEIISFQVAVEGSVKACRMDVSALKGAGEIPNSGVRLFRNWYVNGHAEYALPLKGTFSCPAKDNNIDGQVLQAITVDYHIPLKAKPGTYTGSVDLYEGDATAKLNLKVEVFPVTIPETINFNPELNCYGGPGKAGSEGFKDSFRIAHYHRCTINRVPYSQSGRIHWDWAPKTDEKGRVTDWTTFDRNLGGLLDGSWFKDNPRAGVPVASLYLPQFEGYPLDYRKHYHPGEGVPVNGGKKWSSSKAYAKEMSLMKLKHDCLARPIEEAIDQAYKDAFVNNTRDFVEHFKKKGWNRTLFQCYLNNKVLWGYCMWVLDEPFDYLDWKALNFWGELWKQGVNDPDVYTRKWQEELFRKGLAAMKRDRPTILYRGDISRAGWQGTLSDGLMNILYANCTAVKWDRRMLEDHKRRMPTILYSYGGCNPYTDTNWSTATWCLQSYAHGCDGVLPWQSLGKGLNNPDPKGSGNALIVDAGEYGHAIASFRIHAMRRGAQDCELLRLLQLKKGWTRHQIAALVMQKIPLANNYHPKRRFIDEVTGTSFRGLSGRSFIELKEGVLRLLSE